MFTIIKKIVADMKEVFILNSKNKLDREYDHINRKRYPVEHYDKLMEIDWESETDF